MRRGLIIAGILLTVLLALGGSAHAASAPILGVNVHPEQDLDAAQVYDVPTYTTVLDRMQQAGAEMVRVPVPWTWLEPNGSGEDDPTYVNTMDEYVQAVKARGMKLVITLVGTPCWASSDPDISCVDGNYPDDGNDITGSNWAPSDDAQAGAAAVDMIKRWDPAALEVWNEPNESQYFVPPDGQSAALAYTDLTRAVYQAVKAASPSTTVVAGVVGLSDTGFLQQLYSDGIGSVSDAISIHPYNLDLTNSWLSWGDPDEPMPSDDPTGSFLTGVPAMHQVMADNGDANKPLWLTEFGYSACDAAPFCLDEQTAATYLAESIKQIEAWPYVSVALVDEAWDSSGAENAWNGFGLLRHDFSRRPSYCAFAEATGAQPDCTSDPLDASSAAQDDLTRAWVLAREYAQANGDSFNGFSPAALAEADSSFSGYALDSEDESPSPQANPKLVGISVTADGTGITLCNVDTAQAYCALETMSPGASQATVSRGEAGSGVWAAEQAVDDGTSTAWSSPSAARAITASLTPTSLVADGTSSTTVTATVNDASGNSVSGDDVVFSSSDAGEHIGPTVDHGDGTYSATVTSSSAPGSVTITATDLSPDPNLSATATLSQTVPAATTATATTATATTPTSAPVQGATPHLPAFRSATADIPLQSARLVLGPGRQLTLTLTNANAFPVRLLALSLAAGRRALGRPAGCRVIEAGAGCRVTLRLSTASVRELRRGGTTALTLTLLAEAPAGDRAVGVDRGRLVSHPV